MTRFHLLALLAISSLTSCQTNQQATLPPLPKVEAHVISGETRVRREIASTTDEALLNAEFQQMLTSEDPAASARAYIDRLNRIYYHTQGLLNDYDARIDEIAKQGEGAAANALLVDDRYSRLMAAWTLREETLEKIKYLYNQTLISEMGRGTDSQMTNDQRERAQLVNKGLREAIFSAPNSTSRLAKQELISDLIQVNQEFHDFQLAHDNQNPETASAVDAFNAKLKEQVFTKSEDLQTFYERNDLQLKRETASAREDKQIKSELDRIAPDMKRQMAQQFEDRAPSSAGFKPGLGKQGMLNGTEFAKGVWALTFDDGPHPIYTLQDLNNLKTSGANAADMKATFFWLAQNVMRMKSIVAQVKESGMTLGNHSFSHPQLPKLGATQLKHEIDDSTAVDVQVYGFKPKFFRCPYGACGSQTSNVRQKIADQGFISVTWNVDTLDWQDKNPSSVYARAKKQMAIARRGIILFHDIHPQSVAASKMLMADFKAGRANGTYRTVTMDEALNELNSAEGMK